MGVGVVIGLLKSHVHFYLRRSWQVNQWVSLCVFVPVSLHFETESLPNLLPLQDGDLPKRVTATIKNLVKNLAKNLVICCMNSPPFTAAGYKDSPSSVCS